MVATRSGAKKAPEVAATTLKAPPKRAGKRKAVEEAAEPPPKATKTSKASKTSKATATEAKAKKPATKAKTKAAAPKPAAARSTRRTAKSEPETQPEPEPEPESTVDNEPKAPKRTARGRKTAAAPAADTAEVARVIEEPAPQQRAAAIASEEPAKPATRSRRAPARQTALRAPSKALATTALDTSTTTTRATRARRAAPVAESPLKAPARKPLRKTTESAAALAIQEALGELPAEYPKTPAHIAASLSTRQGFNALPAGYPETPAHIAAPLSTRAALNELPDYPKTPAHIVAPISTREALDALPAEYPKTPAHIVAPLSNRKALNELPADYPKTPAHITAPLSTREALNELPDYPKTPSHIAKALWAQKALNELPADSQQMPAHITAPLSLREALDELPDHPKTPAQNAAPLTPQEGFNALPAGYPETPAYIQAPQNMEAAVQGAVNTPINEPKKLGPLDIPGLQDISFEYAQVEDIEQGYMDIDTDETTISDSSPPLAGTPFASFSPRNNITLAAPEVPSLPAPGSVSPTKRSALRSPLKLDSKTPKKTVTWNDESESEFLLYDGPLRGMTFFVDVTSNSKNQSYLFTTLLEDMGAQVLPDWNEHSVLSHVLFKDGSRSTLDKVVASNGAVKCVNVGWLLDSEKNKIRMDETPYLVDAATAKTLPTPPRVFRRAPFTPAKSPSRYILPPSSSSIKSLPTTPTSSEFERSMTEDEDKENSAIGIFFKDQMPSCMKTAQPKRTWLMNKSPIKTPSKPDFLAKNPMKALSTTKKRPATFGAIEMAPPKKLRFM